MSKVAFVFPGQGAQVINMGKDIIESKDEAKAVFNKACELLDYDLKHICFEENILLHQTQYAQSALLAVEISLLKAVSQWITTPDYVAGLSLGEYSALVANGTITFEDGIKLVRQRGLLMEEAANQTKGTMAAILGSTEDCIQSVLDTVNGYVAIANYNSPRQIVISGEIEGVKEALVKFEEAGIKAVPIQVSGAFHSNLMESAKEGLRTHLESITYQDFSIPYVSNVTGEVVKDKEAVKDLLIEQLTSPVKWVQCVETLINEGVDTFIEIGPSKVLKGLIKKINRKVKVYSVSDYESLLEIQALMESE